MYPQRILTGITKLLLKHRLTKSHSMVRHTLWCHVPRCFKVFLLCSCIVVFFSYSHLLSFHSLHHYVPLQISLSCTNKLSKKCYYSTTKLLQSLIIV